MEAKIVCFFKSQLRAQLSQYSKLIECFLIDALWFLIRLDSALPVYFVLLHLMPVFEFPKEAKLHSSIYKSNYSTLSTWTMCFRICTSNSGQKYNNQWWNQRWIHGHISLRKVKLLTSFSMYLCFNNNYQTFSLFSFHHFEHQSFILWCWRWKIKFE